MQTNKTEKTKTALFSTRMWPCYANNESIFIDIQINVIWWENRWLQVIGIIDPLPHI